MQTKKPLPAWLPLIVGAVLVVLFAGLSVWQFSRGLDKRASQQVFNQETGFAAWQDGMEIQPHQRLKATGTYDGAHQLLLENIIVNSRYGYYVVTPLLSQDDAPALLVNRGWIEKTGEDLDIGPLATPEGRVTVRGRAGSLPRAAYKMGDAIGPATDWPMSAVYPTLTEVATALGREVQPFVLLMDHEEARGFYRHWVPTGLGPDKHFGYAFQWFAMGAMLAGLLIWNYRKKSFAS